MSKGDHIVSARYTEPVYEALLKKSLECNLSISALVRTLIISAVMPDESEHDKIRPYGNSRTEKAAALHAQKKGVAI